MSLTRCPPFVVVLFRLVYPKAISSADAFAADPTDHLKLSFKLENKERPHQAMVRFESKDDHADQIMVAASVKKVSGKGRFELVSQSGPLTPFCNMSW